MPCRSWGWSRSSIPVNVHACMYRCHVTMVEGEREGEGEGEGRLFFFLFFFSFFFPRAARLKGFQRKQGYVHV